MHPEPCLAQDMLAQPYGRIVSSYHLLPLTGQVGCYYACQGHQRVPSRCLKTQEFRLTSPRTAIPRLKSRDALLYRAWRFWYPSQSSFSQASSSNSVNHPILRQSPFTCYNTTLVGSGTRGSLRAAATISNVQQQNRNIFCCSVQHSLVYHTAQSVSTPAHRCLRSNWTVSLPGSQVAAS
jgi:hypothetical protein